MGYCPDERLGLGKETRLQVKMRKPATASPTLLGERLRQWRKDNQLTQTDVKGRLASRGWVDGSVDYLSKIETGRIKRSPDEAFLAALALEWNQNIDQVRGLCAPRGDSHGILEQSALPSSTGAFKLVFGHSLWGAPLFEAAHGGYIKNFQMASFFHDLPADGSSTPILAWVKPGEQFPTPRPRSTLAALSASDVVELLRKKEADVGALPGTVAKENDDLEIVGTIVDSVAGCTFVCEADKLDEWQKEGLLVPPKSLRRQQPDDRDNRPFTSPVSTRDLYEVFRFEKGTKSRISFRVGAEEDTVAYDFLRDACDQDRKATILLRDIHWHFRTRDLTQVSFGALKRDCQERVHAKLVGAIVWEPHATWMRLLQDKTAQLRKIPLNFAPGELGRPKHYTYVVVVPRNLLTDRNSRRRELINAIAELMAVLDTRAERLNNLSPNRRSETDLERLSRYFGLIKDHDDGSPLLDWTLDAVGSILYSVRWTTRGRDLVR